MECQYMEFDWNLAAQAWDLVHARTTTRVLKKNVWRVSASCEGKHKRLARQCQLWIANIGQRFSIHHAGLAFF